MVRTTTNTGYLLLLYLPSDFFFIALTHAINDFNRTLTR